MLATRTVADMMTAKASTVGFMLPDEVLCFRQNDASRSTTKLPMTLCRVTIGQSSAVACQSIPRHSPAGRSCQRVLHDDAGRSVDAVARVAEYTAERVQRWMSISTVASLNDTRYNAGP